MHCTCQNWLCTSLSRWDYLYPYTDNSDLISRLRGTVSATHIFVHVMLLTATLFRCVMTLIQGLRGKKPCPKCLVPSDKLSDLFQTYEQRTAAKTQLILADAASQSTADGKEQVLKDKGLRYVEVSHQPNSDTLCHLMPRIEHFHSDAVY